MPAWAAPLIGLAGVIIGALLRPIVDNYFELRKKTLRINLSENKVETLPAHDAMKITWEGRVISRIIRYRFSISNKTGRTLRNFAIRLELVDKMRVQDEEFVLSTSILERSGAKFEEVATDGTERRLYKFEYFEPNVNLEGFAVSNAEGELKFTTPDDLEISTKHGQLNPSGAKTVERLLVTLAAFLVMAASVGSLFGGVTELFKSLLR